MSKVIPKEIRTVGDALALIGKLRFSQLDRQKELIKNAIEEKILNIITLEKPIEDQRNTEFDKKTARALTMLATQLGL